MEAWPSMKDPCISREQYKGIHDVVNDQGFDMHYTAISNTISHLELFQCERINTAKQKDGLTSFLMLSVLEAKKFQNGGCGQNLGLWLPYGPPNEPPCGPHLRWMVPVFRFFEYVNFERKEQKVNSTS